jgi:hypothetical protein
MNFPIRFNFMADVRTFLQVLVPNEIEGILLLDLINLVGLI